MVIIAYILIGVIVYAFLKFPRYGVLAAIGSKPVIDMFWGAKAFGGISPLMVAALIVPLMAILGLNRINARSIKLQEDFAVIAFLLVLAIITMLRILIAPDYIMNSIEFFIRFLSTTLFYFIGKYYFQTEGQRKMLIFVVLLSFLPPFLLTLGQKFIGFNLNTFVEAMAMAGEGAASNEVSGYYMHARHGLQRISGVYEGIYELAFMGVFTVLILGALFEAPTFKFRIWHLVFLLIGSYFLYMTYSRSAWIVAMGAVFLYLLIKKRFVWIVALSAAAVIAYFSVTTIQHRFEDELGFLMAEKDFASFGYGRGGKWLRLFDGFAQQDFRYQMLGNFGLGNAENQFLGMLLWFGYIGLFALLALLIYLSIRLMAAAHVLGRDRSFTANVGIMMCCLCVVGYWIGGLGNFFLTQISTQWILWTFAGSALAHAKFIKTAIEQRQ